MAFDATLLDILACAESKEPLVYFEEEQFLYCAASRLRYPIRDGIPVMLIEEAERLSAEAGGELMALARDRGLPNAV